MRLIFVLVVLASFHVNAQQKSDSCIVPVQRQLDAYNAHDIEAFVEPYADGVEIYFFPNKLMMKGKENLKTDYAVFFKNNSALHCEVKNRIVQGNTVIDKEYVTGAGDPFEAVAIYEIENGKIQRVHFVY